MIPSSERAGPKFTHVEMFKKKRGTVIVISIGMAENDQEPPYTGISGTHLQGFLYPLRFQFDDLSELSCKDARAG